MQRLCGAVARLALGQLEIEVLHRAEAARATGQLSRSFSSSLGREGAGTAQLWVLSLASTSARQSRSLSSALRLGGEIEQSHAVGYIHGPVPVLPVLKKHIVSSAADAPPGHAHCGLRRGHMPLRIEAVDLHTAGEACSLVQQSLCDALAEHLFSDLRPIESDASCAVWPHRLHPLCKSNERARCRQHLRALRCSTQHGGRHVAIASWSGRRTARVTCQFEWNRRPLLPLDCGATGAR
jgi:hypothetical protein